MTRCFEPEEIGAVLDLPADDPARRHLDTCPRCRNLALAYYQYVEGDDADGGGNGRVRLDADLQRRLAVAFASRRSHAVNGARTTRRGGTPWVLWLSAAVALTALVILLVTGNLTGSSRRGAAGRGALRGEDPNAGLVATSGPDGLRLEWHVGRRPSTYVITFYDNELRILGRSEVVGGGLDVPASDPLAAAAYCRVFRVVGTDTVSRSELVAPAAAKE